MRKAPTPFRSRARSQVHWPLLALGAGAVVVLAVVVGRAIITIVTMD